MFGSDRSIEKLTDYCQRLGMKFSRSTLANYSAIYHWQQRIMELDAKIAQDSDEKLIAQVKAMDDYHAKIGRGMVQIAQGGMQNYFEQLKIDGKLNLRAYDIAALAQTGQRVERLARGQATSRTEVMVDVISTVNQQVGLIFLQANQLEDAEARKREFARLYDEYMAEHYKRLPQGRDE